MNTIHYQPIGVMIFIILLCSIPFAVMAYHKWQRGKHYRAHQRRMRDLRGPGHPLNDLSMPALRAIERAMRDDDGYERWEEYGYSSPEEYAQEESERYTNKGEF